MHSSRMPTACLLTVPYSGVTWRGRGCGWRGVCPPLQWNRKTPYLTVERAIIASIEAKNRYLTVVRHLRVFYRSMVFYHSMVYGNHRNMDQSNCGDMASSCCICPLRHVLQLYLKNKHVRLVSTK